MIVIDPRRTETAQKADRHYFIKPETDALFLASILQVIVEKNAVRLGHLESMTKGLEEVIDSVQEFTPERGAPITGIAEEEIRQIADELLAAKSAVSHSRVGTSVQQFGGLATWLNYLLNILTGNMDSEGGAMFPMPAVDLAMANNKKGRPSNYGKFTSRVSGYPYYNSEFPVVALAEDIETEGEGQIKALLTVAGNPAVSAPNGKRLERAFEQLEFMVCIDIYLNETTRHADIILPAATGLESSNYDVVFSSASVRNNAKYSPALFPREAHQRYDWEILKALTLKYTGQPDTGVTPEVILDNFLQQGFYGKDGLSLEKLKAHPHGLDLGPLTSCLKYRLQTDDEMIDLAPELFINDLDRLKATFFEAKSENSAYPFALISRRVLRHHNTWTHNADRLMTGRNQCTLLIHPSDAKELNIEDGESVSVTSTVGQVEVEIAISDEMMKGVVCMPQGWGSRKGTGMKVAEAYGGVSINYLIDENRVDELTGNAALMGMKVRVEKIKTLSE